MRRSLVLLVLCGLVVTAGCVEAGVDLGTDPVLDDTGLGGPSTDSPSTSGHVASGTFEVHVIDVGQADATLLRTANETMVIDTGDWRDDGETVIEYLEAHGVDRIDHLVSTHAHADHVGGHAAVIDYYETEKDGVGAVYDSGVPHTSQTYEHYLDAVERHDVTLYEVSEGDEIPFEGVRAIVVNPEEPGGDDLHRNSVAVHLRFGETTFLFTGDAEYEAERRMVNTHGETLDADVYQAGHHGSSDASSPTFLDAVDPEVAAISAGYDSEYGHPHQETLQRFAERDVRTLWTGVHGTIVFVSDGESITVKTQTDATTDPLDIRSEPESTGTPSGSVETRFVVGNATTSSRVAATAGGSP